MKTSNKLLIGLVASIFIVITAAFIDIKVFGVHRNVDNRLKKTYNFDLEDYKYLKVSDLSSLEIRSSTYNHLNFIAYNDTSEVAISYHVENDTLFLSGISSPAYYTHYSLYTHSEIKFIASTDSKIEFTGLKQEKLELALDGGEAYCWGKDLQSQSEFKQFKIDQVNARSNLHNMKVDTLDITLDNSRAGFTKDIIAVRADIKGKSNLQLRNVSDLQFKKDKESKVYFH